MRELPICRLVLIHALKFNIVYTLRLFSWVGFFFVCLCFVSLFVCFVLFYGVFISVSTYCSQYMWFNKTKLKQTTVFNKICPSSCSSRISKLISFNSDNVLFIITDWYFNQFFIQPTILIPIFIFFTLANYFYLLKFR